MPPIYVRDEPLESSRRHPLNHPNRLQLDLALE
jgi:hypothetical protein